MKKTLTITKVKKLIRVLEIVQDLQSETKDEEILEKYDISIEQLGKVYSKLYYGGFLTERELIRRVELREGRDASHIPLAMVDDQGYLYECTLCGFSSPRHFSRCPRCREIHLRRLTREALYRDITRARFNKTA